MLKFNGRKESSKEYVVCFLDFVGANAHALIYVSEQLSKSLTSQAYPWYINLKLG